MTLRDREPLKENEIQCPHCDALYILGAVNPHPTPVVCRQCGRLMYDGRRVITPAGK